MSGGVPGSVWECVGVSLSVCECLEGVWKCVGKHFQGLKGLLFLWSYYM